MLIVDGGLSHAVLGVGAAGYEVHMSEARRYTWVLPDEGSVSCRNAGGLVDGDEVSCSRTKVGVKRTLLDHWVACRALEGISC